MHNLNIDKIIKEDIKEEQDDLREDLPIGAKAQMDSRRTKKGLYDLHKDRQAELERKRGEQANLASHLANKTFKNPESEQMVINAFKKEFRQKLAKLMGIMKPGEPNSNTKRSAMHSPRDTERSKSTELPDPKNYILNFEQV